MSRPLADDKVERIAGAIREGKKLDAIRMYREFSGADLKTAKDFVDDLDRRLQDEPAEERKDVRVIGCGPVFFGICLVCFGVMYALVGLNDIWPTPYRVLFFARTGGTVAAVEEKPEEASTLVAEFQVDDQLFQARQRLLVEPRRSYKVGQTVDVLYERSRPSNAIVDTLPAVWPDFLAYFIGPGVLFAAGGVALIVWRKQIRGSNAVEFYLRK